MSKIMTLPKIGVNMTEAIIDEWFVKPGDVIKKGDAIFLAETDKATQEIFATDFGTIEKLLAEQGDTVEIHQPIMTLLDEGEQIGEDEFAEEAMQEEQTAPELQAEVQAPAVVEIVIAKAAEPKQTKADTARVRISPLAKKTAKELGLDISKLSPEQPGKRITKSDVMKFEKAQGSAAVREAAVVGTGSSFATMQIKACADNMTLLIKRFGQSGLDIGHIDVVAKAAAVALSKHKGLFFSGDEINIGVEADTQSGAVVPVASGADKKTVGQIKADIDAMSLGNANFVITNLGAFDIESYVPSRNIFGCTTLCAGCVTRSFVPDERDMPKTRSEIKMTLVFDDSAAAGIDAAKFMQKVKQYIENPELMLL